ncbi:hypothetical protein ACFLRA_00605 [Bdellovibrionota bacterium]
MRLAVGLLFGFMAVCISLPAMSTSPADSLLKGIKLAQAEAPPSCAEQCEQTKDQCMASHTQEGQFGQQFVPPEEVAACMEAFRSCTAGCSRTIY